MNAAEVSERVAVVRQRIIDAGGLHVELVAVTKTFDETSWLAAREAGVDGVGENYAQELVAKAQHVPLEMRPPVHFIGQLQSNKVKSLVEIVDVWQSVDRTSLIDEISRRSPSKPPRIYVQVNTTMESGKGGCDPEATATVVAHAARAQPTDFLFFCVAHRFSPRSPNSMLPGSLLTLDLAMQDSHPP